jgi:hypothetical protein
MRVTPLLDRPIIGHRPCPSLGANADVEDVSITAYRPPAPSPGA